MKAKENKAWEKEIVSCVKHYEVNNDLCHNFYWLVKVRIWTGHNTYFRRKFIVSYNSFELQDWYEREKDFELKDWYGYKMSISQAKKRKYALELAWSFLSRVPTKGKVTCNALSQFTEDCNESIRHFNMISA